MNACGIKHEMLTGLCRRLQLAFPDEISLQMGDGAWVRLKGLGSGAGKTTLGVGYDLLAGLSMAEMEAVLAHEMTHAKLIHRGYRNWVWGVQSRSGIWRSPFGPKSTRPGAPSDPLLWRRRYLRWWTGWCASARA